jgi:CheY-like chemotaxis protein
MEAGVADHILGLGGNYRLARTKRSLIFSGMKYRPPTVKLPIPPEKIDGQTVTFRPVRDGIDSEVSGVMQVIEEADGFNVNASYIVSQNPPLSRVYWFDQSEIDAIAGSAVKEKRRILIVDDDRESTHLVKILLERTGSYLVLEENDATKAYQSAQNFKPDVILLDIMMPETDGAEVAAQIEADPELQRTPIIFLTALVTKPETKAGLRIQRHLSLAKPINIPELINGIEENLPAIARDPFH